MHHNSQSLSDQYPEQESHIDVLTTEVSGANDFQHLISELPTFQMPAFQKHSGRHVAVDLPTVELSTLPGPLPKTDPSALDDIPTVQLASVPSRSLSRAALAEDVENTPSAGSPHGISSLSQKIQAVTQRMPVVTHTVESITQKVQAITQKVQALLWRQPYRVKQLGVMTVTQRVSYLFLTICWIATNAYFWYWWLQRGHLGNPILFGLMSFAFFYEATVLPSFYVFYLGNMKQPEIVPTNIIDEKIIKKVAVISLTVPGSEDLDIVKQQMISMTKIDYPHESWILVDKMHSPEIQALAKEVGVFYFSRHDVATWGEEQVNRWNDPNPPFKAKTKAGNVNSWIDAYGSRYSHFTQLDIDHKPLTSYLHKVLGYFLDTKVKWVQAPSVYGNLDSWTARGSAEQEFVLQGPLQMGFYGFCQTPFIIGSHCTYDMTAVREIGGFQPTRAEDHLDTVFLAARGYQGVFVPEVIAIGDGPENFDTYLAQQFAWAYSMIQVLFKYTPQCIKNYTVRQSLQFLFVQTWYVMWSLTMFLLFVLPIISLFFNAPIAHVNYWDFLLHSLPVTCAAFLVWSWSRTWHKPYQLGLSWRGVILHIARWPVVLSAFVQVILRVQKPYMITVKGLQRGRKRPFPLKSHYPYIVLILLSLGACWFYLLVTKQSSAQGYLLFALQGSLMILLVYVTALFMDIVDMIHEGISFFSSLLLRVKPLLLLIILSGMFSWSAWASWPAIYAAIMGR